MTWWLLWLVPLAALGEVTELTNSTIDDWVTENSPRGALVLFYATWCYYCKLLQPEFDKSSIALGSQIALGRVDVPKYANLADAYHVQRFPTIRLFLEDQVTYDFDERERSSEAIVKWINNRMNSLNEVSTVEDFDSIVESHHRDVVMLLYASTSEDFQMMHSHWLRLSRLSSNVLFFVTQRPEIAKHILEDLCDVEELNYQPPVSVNRTFAALFNPHHYGDEDSMSFYHEAAYEHESQIFILPDQLSEVLPHEIIRPTFSPRTDVEMIRRELTNLHGMLTAISAFEFPPIMRFSNAAANRLLMTRRAILLIAGNPEDFEDLEDDLWEMSRVYRGKLVVVAADDVESSATRRLMSLVGIDESEHQGVRLFTIGYGSHGRVQIASTYKPNFDLFSLNLHFHLNKTHEVEDPYGPGQTAFHLLRTWLNSFLAGTLEAFVRSEPIPDEPDVDGITTLVALNFAEEVMHTVDEDVFVNFYAPWCGHCRVIEPEFRRLAKYLNFVTKTRLAKIDATRNQITTVAIRAFPTLILFPAGNKTNPIEYHGRRTAEAMLSFLAENTSGKFDPRVIIEASVAKSTGGGNILSSDDRRRIALDEL